MTDIPWGEQPTEEMDLHQYYEKLEDALNYQDSLPEQKFKPKAFEPVVGFHGECIWGTKVTWCECVILPEGKLIYKNTNLPIDRWIEMDIPENAEFRPIKSDRELFIEKANNAIRGDIFTIDDRLGAMYDAGFKAPEGDL